MKTPDLIKCSVLVFQDYSMVKWRIWKMKRKESSLQNVDPHWLLLKAMAFSRAYSGYLLILSSTAFCLRLWSCNFKLEQLYSFNSFIAVMPLQLMVSGVLGCHGVLAVRLAGKVLKHDWGSAITLLLHTMDHTVRGLTHRFRFAARDAAQVRCVGHKGNDDRLVISFPNSIENFPVLKVQSLEKFHSSL